MRGDDYLPPEECLAADERPVGKRTRYITDYELSYAPCDEPTEAYKIKRISRYKERKTNASRNIHRF